MGWDLNELGDVVGIAASDFRYEFERPNSGGLWERAIVDCPEMVDRVVRDHTLAGADLIVAFTERLNRATLMGLSDDSTSDVDAVIGWNSSIVARLKNAIAPLGRQPLVFAAIGPDESLWMLEETGEKVLREAYSEQARHCIDAGADGFLCRSFSEIETLCAAVGAVRSCTELPIIGSMTFDAGPDAMDTTAGVSIPEACRALEQAGADMVGFDRGEYPDGAAAVISLMAQSTSLPVYAEINAGRAEIVDSRIVYQEPAAAFGDRLERLRDAGAKLVGGGLGASPAHIAQLIRQRERLVRKARRATGDGG